MSPSWYLRGDELEKAQDDLATTQTSRDFYKRRCEAMQSIQASMRDPERKAVCDILANGSTTALP